MEPTHTIGLMQSHGFITHGPTLKEAVYRAIYTAEISRVHTTAMLLANKSLARALNEREVEGCESSIGLRLREHGYLGMGGGESQACALTRRGVEEKHGAVGAKNR